MPNGKHVVTASWDCVRLWDLEKAQPVTFESKEKEKGRGWGGKGVEVVGGHYGGTVSAIRAFTLSEESYLAQKKKTDCSKLNVHRYRSIGEMDVYDFGQ